MSDFLRHDPAYSHVKFRGYGSEIQTAPENIGEGVVIAGWCFIGKGAKIGPRTRISNFVEINPDCEIGADILVNPYSIFNSGTKIGDGTIIGAHVSTADERHMTARTERVRRIQCEIGKDCRIGTHTSIISSKIGDHSSTGAGSVVTKDIPPCQVWAGVPARYMRDMTKEELEL